MFGWFLKTHLIYVAKTGSPLVKFQMFHCKMFFKISFLGFIKASGG